MVREDKEPNILGIPKDEVASSARGLIQAINPIHDKALANDVSGNLEENKKFTQDIIDAAARFNKRPGEITESEVQKHLIEKAREKEAEDKAKEALMQVLLAAGFSKASREI